MCVCVHHSEILALDLLERQDVTYVDSTVKQIDLSPPDLYFLYLCVLMLCLYASGLTHLTTAVHVPFIKDRGTAACLCVCVVGPEGLGCIWKRTNATKLVGDKRSSVGKARFNLKSCAAN